MENNQEQQRGPRLPKGRYRGRAAHWELANSPDKGTPYMFVEFEIVDDEFRGQRVSWNGWLTDKATPRTMEAMRHCGWSNDDVANPEGMGDNEVELEVEHETYNDKTFARVAFVNALGGFRPKAPMGKDAAAALAARLRDQAAASRIKAANQPPPADVPTTGPDGKPLPF